MVRVSQRLLGIRNRPAAMLWTAVGIWIEPLRSTFDYGQVNVILVLAGLWAAQHPVVGVRPAGGVAAGIS